jgi:hypothetical protein
MNMKPTGKWRMSYLDGDEYKEIRRYTYIVYITALAAIVAMCIVCLKVAPKNAGIDPDKVRTPPAVMIAAVSAAVIIVSVTVFAGIRMRMLGLSAVWADYMRSTLVARCAALCATLLIFARVGTEVVHAIMWPFRDFRVKNH